VQVIPHITDEIKARRSCGRHDGADVVIVEIGGTVGDIESPAVPRGDPPDRATKSAARTSLYVHLTLVPYIAAAGELKTKPTQHSVKELREIGIAARHPARPQRPEHPLGETNATRSRSSATSIPRRSSRRATCASIYEVPLALHREGLDDRAGRSLDIWKPGPTAGAHGRTSSRR
jgi:CTP synthase